MIPQELILKIADFNILETPILNKYHYKYFRGKLILNANKIKKWYKKNRINIKLQEISKLSPFLYTKNTIIGLYMKYFGTEFLIIYLKILANRNNNENYILISKNIKSRYDCYLFLKMLKKDEILLGLNEFSYIYL